MEFLEEARALIFELDFLTPTEQCYLISQVAKANFTDWSTCESWIKDNAFAMVESDYAQDEYDEARKRNL
jgi:hypothetical protein